MSQQSFNLACSDKLHTGHAGETGRRWYLFTTTKLSQGYTLVRKLDGQFRIRSPSVWNWYHIFHLKGFTRTLTHAGLGALTSPACVLTTWFGSAGAPMKLIQISVFIFLPAFMWEGSRACCRFWRRTLSFGLTRGTARHRVPWQQCY